MHGQTTIASGGLEPEATGANHSSRPINGEFSGVDRSRQAGEQGGLGFGRARRQFEIHFLAGDDLRRLRIEQLHVAAGGQQAFEQAQAVGHAGGAGQGEADGLGH